MVKNKNDVNRKLRTEVQGQWHKVLVVLFLGHLLEGHSNVFEPVKKVTMDSNELGQCKNNEMAPFWCQPKQTEV